MGRKIDYLMINRIYRNCISAIKVRKDWGGNPNQEHQHEEAIMRRRLRVNHNYMTKLPDTCHSVRYDIKHIRQEPENLTNSLTREN